MDIQEQTLFASRTQEHPHQLLLLRVLGLRRRLVRIVCRVRCLVRISMWVQRLCVLRLPRRLLLLLRVLGLRRRLVRIVCRVRCLVRISMWVRQLCVLQLQ
jgi:hypothetical protein